MKIISQDQNEKTDEKNDIDKLEVTEELIKGFKNDEKLSIPLQNEIIIKDSKYYREKIKKNKKSILIFMGFGLSYLFYFFSLQSCFEGEGPCSWNIGWIKRKIFEEILSCIILTIMIQLILFKVVEKKHLIHIIIIFIFFYYYRHGMDFVDHGYFNFFFYFILLAIFNVAMAPLDIMIFCLKKKKKKLILIYLGSFFLFSIIVYSYLINFKSNCSDWSKGLNNTSIENDSTKYGCQIKIPKKCTYKIFGFIQDYTKIRGLNCQNINNKKLKEKFLSYSSSPYINKKTVRFGFPLTNKDSICFKDFDEDNPIFKYVFNNLVDMDNKEILDKYYKDKIPEIEIDFSDNDKGKLIIDVKFNKTLSEERKKLESNSKPYSNNVLLLYIDSVSRANALRQLKKTMSFFENFMSYEGGFNEKYPSEIFHSFQFFKYHSFFGYTSINYPFLFLGEKGDNNNKHIITQYLKKNGYITCNVHDYCEFDNTRIYHNYTIDEVFDHQYLSCDPNNDHINVNVIRCLYDKQNIEYLLDYFEQFWRKYKDNRKYASIFTNHGHEGTLSVIKYQDEILSDFLKRLFNDNLLKDTTIIFLSDHGVGMPSIYYIYDFYKTEIHLPSFFMIINDRKNISYAKQYEFIQENQQNFITAFDIYNTLGNIIYGDEYDNIPNKTAEIDSFKSGLGISLFNKINSKVRFPKIYTTYSQMSESVCI